MKKIIFLLLSIPAIAFAGGLYQEVTQPISGVVQEYLRFSRIEAVNPLNGDPVMEFTSERVKLYPTGDVLKTFNRRTKLSASKYAGVAIPLLNPATGEQIGNTSAEQAYAILYSLAIFSEQEADKALIPNPPDTSCYTTNGQVVCP